MITETEKVPPQKCLRPLQMLLERRPEIKADLNSLSEPTEY